MKLCSKLATGLLVVMMMVGMSTANAGSPTLYGKIHTSLDYMDNGGDGSTKYEQTALNSNASRIGVKGSEDIGNGMSVGYLIEWTVDMTGDGNDMGIRNRAVTVSGDYGTVLFGKWDTPMKTLGRRVDLFGDKVGDLRNMTSINAVGDNVKISGSSIDQRWDNTIQYATPNISGFKGQFAYSTDTDTDTDFGVDHSDDNDDNSGYSFNAVYERGIYMVGVGYVYTDSNDNFNFVSEDQEAWRIGGKVRALKGLDIVGSYTKIYNSSFVDSLDTYVASIGGAYEMGNNVFKVQYAMRDDYSKYDDTGVENITVGVDHTLSKRTNVYVAYSITDNDDNTGNTPWLVNHDGDALGSIGDNADVFSLGIVHNF